MLHAGEQSDASWRQSIRARIDEVCEPTSLVTQIEPICWLYLCSVNQIAEVYQERDRPRVLDPACRYLVS